MSLMNDLVHCEGDMCCIKQIECKVFLYQGA